MQKMVTNFKFTSETKETEGWHTRRAGVSPSKNITPRTCQVIKVPDHGDQVCEWFFGFPSSFYGRVAGL